MGELRIGKRQSLQPSPLEAAGGPSVLDSLAPPATGAVATALASPWGILIVFPSLVLAVGLFLTLMAQNALRGSNLELARTRMADRAVLVSEHLGAALGQSDAILEDLASFAANVDSTSEPSKVAFALRHLMHGRPGASYISLSFPDGTFEGAFVDQDGKTRFQVSRILPGYSEERVFEYGERETLTLAELRRSSYDPRTRGFYQLALENNGHVWTEPYTFAGSGETGITRTRALRMGGPSVHAVLTVDFDVRRLSPLLARKDKQDERAILFDDKGTILADQQAKLTTQRAGEAFRLLDYRTLGDPVLSAFFQHQAEFGKGGFFGFDAPSGAHLAATARLRGAESLGWSVAFLAPEATFLASLRDYSQRSYILAGVAMLLATLLSTGFARLIVRVRKEASVARDAARRARKEARELGSYRLVEKLGAGGMGEVWRAEHRLLARQAAIKLIRQEEGVTVGKVAQERFRREAQSLASLRSRNTIELFDYGVTEDGTFFYVMELLDGLDLETLVNRDGAQPPARTVKLLIQACRSLAEAHAAGLVHRDVKPANIFVCRVADELDIVKVLDFGLVRTISDEEQLAGEGSVPPPSDLPDESSERPSALARGAQEPTSAPRLTRADHVMGTPDFMAPEQAMGGQVDARADIYALGGVAFWLLAARPVFLAKSVLGQLTAQMSEQPVPLADVCPSAIPPALAALVHSCLAKAPDERPQTAAELLEHLQAIDREIGAEWDSRVEAWWQGWQRDAAEPIAGSATMVQEQGTAMTLNIVVSVPELNIVRARPGR
jgi:serine/threonine protein kinase